ncbi:MT-A70-domain-containing protein [Viridothelium virens]|uniref:MT-A70-domain-containing protein n=1 Tax=Viridothelium virens TaxID=1048519 RepID=A0A6A6HLK7_VIRVR|nr:MT-A70-domain-containing protein [Viridothelium virens]
MPPQASTIKRSIIYQNDEQTVTLLDIPASISEAQSASTHSIGEIIYSCEPLEEPFDDNEPKSTTARKQIDLQSVDSNLHSIYASLINDALAETRSEHRGIWCLPRGWSFARSGTGRKRKADVVGGQEVVDNYAENSPHSNTTRPSKVIDDLGSNEIMVLDSMLADLAHGDKESVLSPDILMSDSAPGSIAIEDAGPGEIARLPSSKTWDNVFHNALDQQLDVELSLQSQEANSSSSRFRFHIPGKSTFMLGNCANASAFRESVRYMSQEYDTCRTFDFILLDPPWPNRSVKRSRTYITERDMRGVKQMLFRMDVDSYMAPGSIVGVWITNKSTVRDLVLGKGGLFEAWNVSPKEEWLWTKTTTKGEPVTSLQGLWRKPYEVLLLGQRPSDPFQVARPSDGFEDVKRRVIIAVPDLHSRKPCLKKLIEPMMRDPASYCALEIFARYLVAGWWSWGDEVLKFNWEGYWGSEDRG